MLRSFVLATIVFSLSGCGIVYKLPTRQGNVIEQEQLDKLKIGMTQDQVHFLLGTPIATSVFETGRWDYFAYYKPPRGTAYRRTVSLNFNDKRLSKIDGLQVANVDKRSNTQDVYTLTEEEKKDKIEKSRDAQPTDSGGVKLPMPAPNR